MDTVWWIIYLAQIPLCVYVLTKMLERKFSDLPMYTQVGILVAAAIPVLGWAIIIYGAFITFIDWPFDVAPKRCKSPPKSKS